MLYFKNVELAEKYHVSLGTIRNWIEAAETGKLALSLHNTDTRAYIANITSNLELMKKLAANGKKYKNTKSRKVIIPTVEFYDFFSRDQVYEIVRDIEVHREIDRKYYYFGTGANIWKQYIDRMADEKSSSNLTMTWRTLEQNQSYIDSLLCDFKTINLVDIGAGESSPVKNLLKHFVDQKKLGRYIALDISNDMLALSEQNIKKWFNGKIHFEKHQLDIESQKFSKYLLEDYAKTEKSSTSNLIVFFGGTLGNLRKREVALQVIQGSMGANDLFIHAQKLDTKTSRTHFDLAPEPGKAVEGYAEVLGHLNIDPAMYELEFGYDERRKERYSRIRLKVSVQIRFEFEKGSREVDLDKGETINLWRARHDSTLDVLTLLDRNGFMPLLINQTLDGSYLLTISKLKPSEHIELDQQDSTL